MKNLINYEFFKLRKRKIFLLIVVICFIGSAIVPFLAKSQILDMAEWNGITLTNEELQEKTIDGLYGTQGYLLKLICLSVVVLSSLSICEEFGKGTIKLLYIRPYSRTKKYFAKYFAILKITLILLFFMMIESYISSSYLFKENVDYLIPMAKTMVLSTLLIIPNIIILEVLCFLISYGITNTAIALLLNFMLSNSFYTGIPVDGLIFPYTYMRYISFQRFILGDSNGNQDYHNLLLKSIIICGIYFILFMYLGVRLARKKDIKNEA